MQMKTIVMAECGREGGADNAGVGAEARCAVRPLCRVRPIVHFFQLYILSYCTFHSIVHFS